MREGGGRGGMKGEEKRNTVKPLIKDTLKEDKPPSKGQAGSIHSIRTTSLQRTKWLVPIPKGGSSVHNHVQLNPSYRPPLT